MTENRPISSLTVKALIHVQDNTANSLTSLVRFKAMARKSIDTKSIMTLWTVNQRNCGHSVRTTAPEGQKRLTGLTALKDSLV